MQFPWGKRMFWNICISDWSRITCSPNNANVPAWGSFHELPWLSHLKWGALILSSSSASHWVSDWKKMFSCVLRKSYCAANGCANMSNSMDDTNIFMQQKKRCEWFRNEGQQDFINWLFHLENILFGALQENYCKHNEQDDHNYIVPEVDKPWHIFEIFI